MKEITVNIVANGVIGYEGLSGGDEIFINFAKYLVRKGIKVNIFTWKHGFLMCQKNKLSGVNFFLSDASRFEKFPSPALYLIRTILGLKKIKEAVAKENFREKKAIIYSASDFWPDVIPAYFFKKWLPSAKWIAGFYLFAPKNLKNIFFFISQKPIFSLIKKYADMICVTSQPDVVPFIEGGREPEDVFVVKGGIDYLYLEKFQKPAKKLFDAVFVGRFHPQKGVVEMIDIWNEIVQKKPAAKLAVIGLGRKEKEMKGRVKQYGLEKNVQFMGVMIGDDRNQVLQQSRIILHPAVYDSGGMAPASGLACGLPGVCFDLPVFKTYYPKGFLHAKVGDIKDFAQKILVLLANRQLYQQMSQEAIEEAKTWDWEKRFEDFFRKVERL